MDRKPQVNSLKNWFIQLTELKDGTKVIYLVGVAPHQPPGTLTFTSKILGADERMVVTKNSIYHIEGVPHPIFNGMLRRIGATYNSDDPLTPQVLDLVRS